MKVSIGNEFVTVESDGEKKAFFGASEEEVAEVIAESNFVDASMETAVNILSNCESVDVPIIQ